MENQCCYKRRSPRNSCYGASRFLLRLDETGHHAAGVVDLGGSGVITESGAVLDSGERLEATVKGVDVAVVA